MLRLSSLLSLFVLLVSVNPSFVSSSRLSSPSSLHRFLLSRRFSPLTAPSPSSVCSPTYGCLPEGFPVPDPSTVHFIQFPNGVSVNLEGYGTVSLPQGYPVSALPSYDSASNTVKDPFFATVLAYALSEVSNPNFNGVWGGFTLPGIGTGVGGGGGGDGGGGTGGDDILSTGVGGGVVEPGSSTGVSVIVPSNTGTSTGSGGITHGGGGGTVSSTGNGSINNNNNNNNGGPPSKNGGSTLAGSIGLVAGLAMAAIFASLF